MKISFKSLTNVNVVKLSIGQITSQIADKVVLIGMIWIIANEFDPKYIPWFLALGGLPHLLFSRLSPKAIAKIGIIKTLYLSDLFRAVLYFVSLVFFKYDYNLLIILFGLNFFSQVGASFFNPAIFASASCLEDGEDIANASALINMSFALANLFGPLFGLIVYQFLGLEYLILINGITYLLSSLLEMTIKVKDIETQEAESEIVENNFFVNNKLITYILIVFLAINLVSGPLLSFIPLYVKEVYNADINSLMLLEAAMGGGALLSGIILSVVIISWPIWLKIFISLLIFCCTYLMFTFSTSLWVGFIALVVLAFVVEANNLFVLYFFQTHPKKHFVPKVMSYVNMISMASFPLSMALTGIMLNFLELTIFAKILALFSIIIALIIPFIPNIRKA